MYNLLNFELSSFDLLDVNVFPKIHSIRIFLAKLYLKTTLNRSTGHWLPNQYYLARTLFIIVNKEEKLNIEHYPGENSHSYINMTLNTLMK